MQEKYFEDFEIGEKFHIPSKTITESHYMLFAALSGDNHPIHYDDEFAAKKTIFKKRLAHGLLLAGMTPVGASNLSFMMGSNVIAFLQQSSKFLKPVFIGDTITPELEVVEKRKTKSAGLIRLKTTIRNQRDEIVLEGEHTYLFKCRET